MDSEIELETFHNQCCIHSKHNHGNFFCAGGPGGNLIHHAKKYLDQIGWEYNGDNAIYALWVLGYIDIYKKHK